MGKFNIQFRPLILPTILLIVSYFSIFRGYAEPDSFFWDENYHIAAAQKYLNSVFFMEPHPPLGKLLIAAGELLLSPNIGTDQFLKFDHAPTSPPGFSFSGYRFFPVLLASFCPLLLFCTLRVFCGSLISFFIGLLFALDNGLIVHLRGAMLEGTQLFFILVFFLALALLIKQIQSGKVHPDLKFLFLTIIIGASLGCVLTTKLNGIILFIPLLPTFYFMFRHKLFLLYTGNLAVSFLAVVLTVWAVHISLGQKIEPKLPDSGYYQASLPYRQALNQEKDKSLNFFAKLYDHFAFLPHYTKGVPELNYCKRDENGSPWYWWLVGGKSINYRWEKEDGLTKFLYLVANPFGWALSLLGVFLALIVVGNRLFFNMQIAKDRIWIIATLLFSWISYMGIFGNLGRVMYLYHYFVPLLIGWIMLGFLAPMLTHIGAFQLTSNFKKIFLFTALSLEVASFALFSPFTYAIGISDKEVAKLNWLSVWDIHCVDCQSGNPLARPIGDPKISTTSNIRISGLRVVETYQAWGEPANDRSVTKEPLIVAGKQYESGIGVHAVSRLVFAPNKKLKQFTAEVGMPDYLNAKTKGSVIFKVVGDGRDLWKSETLSAGMPTAMVSLDISKVDKLVLEVEDAGDGNTDDHAVWLNPRFE